MLAPAVNAVLRAAGRPGVLVGSAFAARADALRSAACFDPAFPFYGEDTRLACALHAKGEVRFMARPLAQTSARRYRRQGLLLTTAKYFAMFSLIQLGAVEFAERLGGRLLAAEQPEILGEIPPRYAPSEYPLAGSIELRGRWRRRHDANYGVTVAPMC